MGGGSTINDIIAVLVGVAIIIAVLAKLTWIGG